MLVLSKMLIAATIGAGAMLAGTANNTTKVPSNQAGTTVFDEETKYFEFVGSNGQEDQPAQWQEISAAQYGSIQCDEEFRGCKLATATVIGDATNGYHPSEIPVDVDPSDPNNMSPVNELPLLDVQNRASSY